jgi:hypothetical protein
MMDKIRNWFGELNQYPTRKEVLIIVAVMHTVFTLL